MRAAFIQFQNMCTKWAGGLEEHATAVAEGKINTTPKGDDGATEDLVMEVPEYDTDSDADVSSDDRLPSLKKMCLEKPSSFNGKQSKRKSSQNIKRQEKKRKR